MYRLTLVKEENPFFPPLCSPQKGLCPVFYYISESQISVLEEMRNAEGFYCAFISEIFWNIVYSYEYE